MGLQPIQWDENLRPASGADQGVRPTLHSSVRDKVFRPTRVAHALFGAASSKDSERTAH